MSIYILHQLLLSDLQLQHDGTELHVEVVGPLQLPLVVLPDVQCMSEGVTKMQICEEKKKKNQHHILPSHINRQHASYPFVFPFLYQPEFIPPASDQLLVQPVDACAFTFDLLKMLLNFLPPLRLLYEWTQNSQNATLSSANELQTKAQQRWKWFVCILLYKSKPETWSRSLEVFQEYQQRQYRDVEGSDGTKAYFWVFLAWNPWENQNSGTNSNILTSQPESDRSSCV